jgi:hypothetical protein
LNYLKSLLVENQDRPIKEEIKLKCEMVVRYVCHISAHALGSQAQDIRNSCDLVCCCRIALEIRHLLASTCLIPELGELLVCLNQLHSKYSSFSAEGKLSTSVKTESEEIDQDDFSDWDEDSDTNNISCVDDSCNVTRSLDSYILSLFDEITEAIRLMS